MTTQITWTDEHRAAIDALMGKLADECSPGRTGDGWLEVHLTSAEWNALSALCELRKAVRGEAT